jgi:hypothetical protein
MWWVAEDSVSDLVAAKKVQALPAFHFYKAG